MTVMGRSPLLLSTSQDENETLLFISTNMAECIRPCIQQRTHFSFHLIKIERCSRGTGRGNGEGDRDKAGWMTGDRCVDTGTTRYDKGRWVQSQAAVRGFKVDDDPFRLPSNRPGKEGRNLQIAVCHRGPRDVGGFHVGRGASSAGETVPRAPAEAGGPCAAIPDLPP